MAWSYPRSPQPCGTQRPCRTRLAVLALLSGSLGLGGRGAPLAHAQRPEAPTPLVFDGVTVIDVAHGTRLPDQRVVIVGNRIQAMGRVRAVRLPKAAHVVEARGKYLTPGFWDMHAHVDSLANRLYPLFIAHGVTGLREMAQRFNHGADSFYVWQRAVMAGRRAGPRVVGPSADISDINVPNVDLSKLSLSPSAMYTAVSALKTPEDARRIIDSLKAAGMAFVKFHGDPDNRAIYFALLREARRVGLPVVGHVPESVTNVEASDSGQYSIEHIEENHQCWPKWPAVLLGDSATAEARCKPMVDAYVRNGTWSMIGLNSHWLDDQYRPDAVPGLWEDMKRFVRMLHRLGQRKFLAGTDYSPYFENWDKRFRPGLSAVEEMVAYFEGGLSPLEALQTGTLNPAIFFHATDSLGTVAPGKLADLVLLDGNPLADIHNVLKLRAVVANGRYFDRAALNALDPEGRRLGGLVAAREHSSPVDTNPGHPNR